MDVGVDGNITEISANTPDQHNTFNDDKVQTDTNVPSTPHTPDKHDIDFGTTLPSGVTAGIWESQLHPDTKVSSDETVVTTKSDTKTDADDIQVILVDDTSADPEQWVEIKCNDDIITLYPENKENIVQRDGWLCDSEITAAQMLLKNQFPYIDGLEDTAIIGDHITPAISEFVQIVNTGNHWVCLSTVGCPPSQVNVFDSLGTAANPVAIEHACRMLVSPKKNVKMVNQKVQVQRNGNDCGLFALAFATEICHGSSPVDCSYDASLLRKHLVCCFEGNHMTPFPRTYRRVIFHKNVKTLNIPIYCICRLPSNNNPYVQCSQCSEWYHQDCVNIPGNVVKSTIPWGCLKCKSS